MNLIEELGLEKCQAIVHGAPKHAEYYSPLSYSNKYKKSVRDNTYEPDVANGYTKSYDFWDGRKWNGCACMLEHLDDLVLISDIRTAIADHSKCQHDWNETTSNGDAYRFFVCKHCDSTRNYVPFEADHCSDIRNHISPLTGVIER